MQFQLITPEKTFFSGDIREVSIPGEDGEFGVLEGHAPFISKLKPGVVTIHETSGEVTKVAVQGGVAEAIPERCSVLAEVATSLTGIPKAQLEEELAKANKAFDKAKDEDAIRDAAGRVAMLEAALLTV